MIPNKDYSKAFTWLVIGLITVAVWWTVYGFIFN